MRTPHDGNDDPDDGGRNSDDDEDEPPEHFQSTSSARTFELRRLLQKSRQTNVEDIPATAKKMPSSLKASVPVFAG